MLHKLKTLLLAMVAITALSAAAASAAHAETAFHTDTNSGSANITTTPDGTTTTAHVVFTAPLGNGAITCNGVDFKGTIANGATSVTLESDSGNANEPFTGCAFLGTSGAFVKMNGCEITLKGGGTAVLGNLTGKTCGGTERIEFGIPSCIAKIGAQSAGGVTYHNVGSEITVSADVTIANVEMVGAGCVATGTGNGTFSTANVLATGLVDGTATMTAISVD